MIQNLIAVAIIFDFITSVMERTWKDEKQTDSEGRVND